MALRQQEKVSTGSETICGSTADTVPANITATPTIMGVYWCRLVRPSRQLRAARCQAIQKVNTASRMGTATQGEMPYSNRRSPFWMVICGSVMKQLLMLSTVITAQQIISPTRTKLPLASV